VNGVGAVFPRAVHKGAIRSNVLWREGIQFFVKKKEFFSGVKRE
jgi:hypothetical protein|tara:strand:- start:594 stop:725 length:132 start_codon:yes stop_codon:yes gene_type:complete